MNKYYEENDYIVGVTNDGTTFKIDKDCYDMVKTLNWSRHRTQIVAYSKTKKEVILSHLILGNQKINKRVLLREPFDFRRDNIFNGNKYVLNGNMYQVECFDRRNFLIDIDDYELIKPYTWHFDKNNYVITKIMGRVIKLHRLIMGVVDSPPNIEIDHINRDTTDNRKSELRLADRSLNCYNQLKNNQRRTSDCRGVYKNTGYDKWLVQINSKGSRIYLGAYDSYDEAVNIRKDAEIKYFGELAPM